MAMRPFLSNLLLLFYQVEGNSDAFIFFVRKAHGYWGLAILERLRGLDNAICSGNSENIYFRGTACPAGRAHCAWGGRSHAFFVASRGASEGWRRMPAAP